MSLVVWLPMTKDLRQQGLSDRSVTNSGATFDLNGKLGGCYVLDGTDDAIGIGDLSTLVETNFSFACWFYHSDTWGTKSYETILGGPSGFELEAKNSSTNSPVIKAYSWGSGSFAYELNKWNHLVMTRTSSETKFYLNGEPKLTGTTGSIPSGDYFVGAWKTSTGQNYKGSICDVRIYDHCLSPMEVKRISQGLVLHYPLSDISVQKMNNCWNLPSFNTSSSAGGSSHWGQSGASGTYGQTENETYIYRSGQQYAHWVSNASTATGDYLLYQSPAFEGGTRSFQCICKEQNGREITNNICYSVWNGRSGGTTNGLWTSINSLGNGFYHCKCENIQQDGTNDLVGIYVKPGYTVYFSEVWLEDDRVKCSDIFFQSSTIYDTSGYCNNGIITGDLVVSEDTPKYSISTHIGTTSSKIHISNFPTTGFGNSYSFAWWGKRTSNSPMFWGFSDGIRLNGMYAGTLWNTGDSSNNPIYKPGTTTTITAPSVNIWHHYVMTGDGTTCKLYLDGELYGQAKTYKAISGTSIYINGWDSSTTYCSNDMSMSDFRIYATALSADDVKSLYQNTATIDADGTIHGAVR